MAWTPTFMKEITRAILGVGIVLRVEEWRKDLGFTSLEGGIANLKR